MRSLKALTMGTELRSLGVEGTTQTRGEEEKMLTARRKQKLTGKKGRERSMDVSYSRCCRW